MPASALVRLATKATGSDSAEPAAAGSDVDACRAGLPVLDLATLAVAKTVGRKAGKASGKTVNPPPHERSGKTGKVPSRAQRSAPAQPEG